METVTVIYKQEKISSINTVFCVIEEEEENCFLVLVYDNFEDYLEGVWIEKSATSYNEAKFIADTLFAEVCSTY